MQAEELESKTRYLPHAFLVAVMAFMAWVRMLPADRALDDGGVFFSGNDPWYHFRVNEYLVEHYPAVMPFDVFTNFPFGSVSSTGFGGLFNQITVFVAMVVGLGNPSQYQLEMVTAIAPVAFGAATAVPVYLIARRLTDRVYGLIAVLSLALITGQFLNRTTFANSQHESAEALFMAFALFGMIYAVDRAYAEKPTLAHLRDRDWQGLKPAAVGSLVGGICLSLYVLTWPAGIFLVFPFGVFITLQMIREHLKGESTEYIALTTAGVFVFSALPVLLYVLLMGMQGRINGAAFSALQPLVLAGAGLGVLSLLGISIYLDENDYDERAYPAAVAGLSVAALGFLWATGLFSLVQTLFRNIYGFGFFVSAGRSTVAEISPASPAQALAGYGLLWVFGFVAMAWLVWRVVRRDRPLEVLVLLWAVTMYSAYFTMVRFGYYMSLAVAVLTAYGIYHAVLLLGIDDLEFDVSDLEELGDSLLKVKGYQAIGIMMMVFMFLPVLLVGLGPGMAPAWDSVRAGGSQPWQQEALPWMEENTPAPGVDYLGEYPLPKDNDFAYPVDESPIQGAYGVMSWWDYGHWITVNAKRIPNANPFQEGNIIASEYLTAQTEERANLLLEALPSMEPDPGNVHQLSDEELRTMVDEQSQQEANEDTRYVVIDDQMAAGKFGAIGTWTGFEGYVERKEINLRENVTESLAATGEAYDDSILARLYLDDARSLEHYRLVHESETYGLIGTSVDLSTGSQRFNQLFNRVPYNQSIGGMGMTIQQLGQFVQRTQAIPTGGNSYIYDVRTAASVKTFERVEGATLVGDSESSNATVLARVELRTENTNRTFTYAHNTTTDEDGEFELTVPYASNHDVPVDEGGTDSAVEPQGDYEVYVGDIGVVKVLGETQVVGQPDEFARVEVSESDVYFGEDVEVDLQEAEPAQGNETGDGDETAG